MDYLGLFCLGAFVGAIATLGIRYINDIAQWQKVLAAVLPAVLSGIVITFVDRFKYSPALGCYPLGLMVALLWSYADTAVTKLQEGPHLGHRTIGRLHVAAAVLVSVGSAVIVLIPTTMQLRAEINTPVAERIRVLQEERSKSLAEAPAASAAASGAAH